MTTETKTTKNTNRGQISLTVAVIGAVGMVLASVLTAWGTSNASVASVQNQVTTVTTKEEDHYGQVQQQLADINDSIKALTAAVNKVSK